MRFSNQIIAWLWLCTAAVAARAQSTAYIVQGGLTIGTQRWEGFDRQPLYRYHAALGFESINNDNPRTSFFGQIGYHVKGSATRFFFFNQVGGGATVFSEPFEFRNIGLTLGLKQRFPLGERGVQYYYFGGLRGEYHLSNNLSELTENNQFLRPFYPSPGGVRKWLGGVSLGGGLEFPFTDLIGMQLGISLQPDLTLQYLQNAIPNVIDPNNPGMNTTIPERRIRNTAIEVSLGLRLLRKVEYIDE
jgi:hypothetical protein